MLSIIHIVDFLSCVCTRFLKRQETRETEEELIAAVIE